MKSNSSTTVSGTDRIVGQFADMMIETITSLQNGWRKTWISTTANGRPVNFGGREYNRFNEFFLYLLCEAKSYQYPVFVTINKANELGASVKKGEKSAPVLFWKLYIKDANGRNITEDDYRQMSRSDQRACDVHPVLKYYNVFNVDQTNLAEVQPEKLKKLVESKFAVPELRSTDGMYENPELDAVIEAQTWVCPVACKEQDRAFYSPATDSITLPLKQQFNLGGSDDEVFLAGQEFYSTMLHEMAHSTGSKNRLNRLGGSSFGSEDYAKEELVAELTAALIGHSLGFNTRVRENNAAYLSSWLKSLKEEPKFLVSVLSDVSKAAQMIEGSLFHKEVA